MNPDKIKVSPCAFCASSGVIENHTGRSITFIHTCNGSPRISLDPATTCLSRVERQRNADGKRIIPIIGYFVHWPSSYRLYIDLSRRR